MLIIYITLLVLKSNHVVWINVLVPLSAVFKHSGTKTVRVRQ